MQLPWRAAVEIRRERGKLKGCRHAARQIWVPIRAAVCSFGYAEAPQRAWSSKQHPGFNVQFFRLTATLQPRGVPRGPWRPLQTGFFTLLLACLALHPHAGAQPLPPHAAAYFEQYIRPVLAENCVKCHGPAKQKGGLRLDTRDAMLQGGKTGPAVAPGKTAESLVIAAIRYHDLEMPPDAPLPEADISRLEQWVAAGAPWPEHAAALREATSKITAGDRAWWAFQPLAMPDVPAVEGDTWSRNPIDRFVYRRLREHDMEPAPQAGKAVLVRRLYFDLTGLPPSPEEIDRFVNDPAPDAWEHLVDRLLDDPRYGEHWARFWLDLVRYAESDGWNQDAYRPQIWRYRDYVVDAFNRDEPYPAFVRAQLAGDEIPEDNPAAITATGYLRLSIYEYNQRDAKGHWNDIMNEITDVTGNVFLGLSMSCSRCHDHKFDPIPQTDYFSLRAFFEPLVWKDNVTAATGAQKAAWAKENMAWEEATADIRARIGALCEPVHAAKWESTVDKFPLDIQACFRKPEAERTSWENQMAYLVARQFTDEGGGPLAGMKKEDKETLAALEKELAAFDDRKPKPLPAVMAAVDFPGTISPTVVPGDPERTPVEPRFLAVLASNPVGGQPALPDLPQSTGRRTALAEWIGRPDNPLTTRVIANRIWQQHFGEGIVPSSSDFGHLGQPPTHPELLDWLTAAFVEQGWQFKRLHKLILMSAAWQQSAAHPRAADYEARDPGEALLWRSRIRRLSAEELRDAMLAASGELDGRVGGPSVDAKTPRRGLYVKRMRNTPEAFLHAFDVADGLTSVSQRNTTTTPTQALLLINGDYTLGRAAKLAERIRDGEFETRQDALVYAFRLAWAREPTAEELGQAMRYAGSGADPESPVLGHEKLIALCHVLLNSNEFMYVD